MGNKAKWVLSWKILNDPLARAMLSDRFLEGWHEATFPQWVNPYKLRRLQQEFSYDMRYWKEQKELINNHGSRFDEARSLF